MVPHTRTEQATERKYVTHHPHHPNAFALRRKFRTALAQCERVPAQCAPVGSHCSGSHCDRTAGLCGGSAFRWVGVSRWVGTSDLPTKRSQSAVEGGGERARGDQQGHWLTAALGVGVVVVACLSDPAGARGAPPRAISLRAPLWHPEIGDDVVRKSGDCGASPKSCRWFR